MQLIDVSNVNGSVNWKAVHASGIRGAWLKASEGATFTDVYFHAHRRDATHVGIRVGAYHFARPDLNSPETEADHFASVIGTIGRRELRPVLDLEHAGGDVEWARAFNRRVRSRTGVIPAFYSYPDFIGRLAPAKPIGNGLWLADYGRNDGHRHPVSVPRPWRKTIAHQYTSTGTVPGVAGRVDRSYTPRLSAILAHPVRGLL